MRVPWGRLYTTDHCLANVMNSPTKGPCFPFQSVLTLRCADGSPRCDTQLVRIDPAGGALHYSGAAGVDVFASEVRRPFHLGIIGLDAAYEVYA